MTKDEALKLALVALEKVTTEMLALKDELAERGARPTTNVFHQRLWDSSFNAYTDHALPAATAIEKALAKQSDEFKCPLCYDDIANIKNPSQPEQEPVAFYVYKPTLPRGHLGNVSDGDLPWVYDQDPSSGYSARMLVYTTPPQRTWVGLTDEDKQTAFDATQEGGGFWEFADAIEAKLKEKNT